MVGDLANANFNIFERISVHTRNIEGVFEADQALWILETIHLTYTSCHVTVASCERWVIYQAVESIAFDWQFPVAPLVWSDKNSIF